MKKVLITGAAGRIGRTLRAGLNGRCDLRLMDREPINDAEVNDVHVGDVADIECMTAVCQGVDAVVHLAGNPSTGASWESVLEVNIKGTYGAYEGARRGGAQRGAQAHAGFRGWGAGMRCGGGSRAPWGLDL